MAGLIAGPESVYERWKVWVYMREREMEKKIQREREKGLKLTVGNLWLFMHVHEAEQRRVP